MSTWTSLDLTLDTSALPENSEAALRDRWQTVPSTFPSYPVTVQVADFPDLTSPERTVTVSNATTTLRTTKDQVQIGPALLHLTPDHATLTLRTPEFPELTALLLFSELHRARGWLPLHASTAARNGHAVSITGIDPHREPRVSALPRHMRDTTIAALYRATNAIILGDRLAEKLGARVGANLTVQTSEGVSLSAQVVGLFHSGVRSVDESSAYVLLKTAQILAKQTALINELRVRVNEPMNADAIAQRIERQTGYKSVSWQEAHEDLLSSFVIRNVIMYTVVGAILLVASFGTYNIISTITHEKARDIAIMKSLGLSEGTVRAIFVLEALIIGLAGALLGFVFGYLLCLALGSIEIKSPFMDTNRLPLVYAPLHYLIAGGVALLSSFVAGYSPARKAARVHPVEIIRGAT